MPFRSRLAPPDAVVVDDLTIRPTRRAVARRQARRSRRSRARRTLLGTIRQIPAYLRLLVGLLADGRVSRTDKLLVAGALAYLLAPLDFIPDFIPFLGQVDDLFLVVTALNRLVERAGRRVLMDHWDGDPEELSDLNFAQVLAAAAVFLPPAMRRRLRRLARR